MTKHDQRKNLLRGFEELQQAITKLRIDRFILNGFLGDSELDGFTRESLVEMVFGDISDLCIDLEVLHSKLYEVWESMKDESDIDR